MWRSVLHVSLGTEGRRGHCQGDNTRWKTRGSCHLELSRLVRRERGGSTQRESEQAQVGVPEVRAMGHKRGLDTWQR